MPYGDFPACEEKPSEKDSGDKYLKTVEATTRPEKWLPSGDLVLEQHSESKMENGGTRDCDQTITVAFDSDHKASVKSAKQHDCAVSFHEAYLDESGRAKKQETGRNERMCFPHSRYFFFSFRKASFAVCAYWPFGSSFKASS